MSRILLSSNVWMPLWKSNLIIAHPWAQRIVNVCENRDALSFRSGRHWKVPTKPYSESSNPKEKLQSDSEQLDNNSSQPRTAADIDSSKAHTTPPHDKGDPSKTNGKPLKPKVT